MVRALPESRVPAWALLVGALVAFAAGAPPLFAAAAPVDGPPGASSGGDGSLNASVGVDAAPAGPNDAVVAIPAGSVAAASVGSHGNHLSVDPQVSSDGTVLVETLFTLGPGFVVLWTDEGGERGDPVGHAALAGGQFRTDVPVTVDESVWNEWPEADGLWAVLHRDDGDGEFDPESDEALTARNPAAAVRLPLGAGDGDDRVLADHVDPQPLTDGAVTVRRVDLSEPGFVAVESRDGATVLGSTRLPAGSHRNVTVPLNESSLADRPNRVRVRAVAYRDDGDGVFGADDSRVTVDGEPVATTLTVRTDGEVDDGPIVNTPGGTPIPSATPSQTPSVTTSPTPTHDTATTDGAGGLGPGFGVGTAVAGLIAALLIALRRQ